MPAELAFKETDVSDLGIPHDLAVNAQTGAASMGVDVPVTAGRNDMHPTLSLVYNSGGSNSTFGLGWSLAGLPSISISSRNGNPDYFPQLPHNTKYEFQGQDLVPVLVEAEGEMRPQVEEVTDYWIFRYRQTIEADFVRCEKWVRKSDQRVHWRARTGDNQTLIFGDDEAGLARVVDPANPENVYQWLVSGSFDDRGNAIAYEYISENTENIDVSSTYEHARRVAGALQAQRYIKKIRYGNRIPTNLDQPTATPQQWLFELVFDYGEHVDEVVPSYAPRVSWPARTDAFSFYAAGFEVRTYRLCRRILMFHHFDEIGPDASLISALTFAYEHDSAGSTMTEIGYAGYRRESTSTYREKSLPPLKFEYTQPTPARSFRPAPRQTTANVPLGIGAGNYRWLDLFGEGLPGVLYETNECWYYKANRGNGELDAQTRLAAKPAAAMGSYTLSDFDGDGNLNLVAIQGGNAGYYEYDREADAWLGYQTFESNPRVNTMVSTTQMLDITGDGRPDIVAVDDDRLTWYPSKGKGGFDAAREISRPRSNGQSCAPTIGSNLELDYFWADMTGDGMPDQVKVRNGRIEYWPNLGNGRFGHGIVMQDSPQIDNEWMLDASRIRLVDLDGNGVADLLYIGRGEIRYWLNASGNHYVFGGVLGGLPLIDDLSSVQVLDYLGNGAACLVWSQGASTERSSSLHYLQLTGEIRPRLLSRLQNSMGRETVLSYGSSANHYIRDMRMGEPWISRLPSHVTVVDRLESIDNISNTKLVQRFEYHEGYFDSEKRQFCGFSQVDQYDSDHYLSADMPGSLHFTAPVCVRTWYHNGNVAWDAKSE